MSCGSGAVAETIRHAGQGGAPTSASPYDVRSFGAKGDGVTKDTEAVNKALEACAKAGGGTVYFAPGVYLCGSLHLRSGATLWIDSGATIKGSPDYADYDPFEKLDFKNDADPETSFFHHALIWGENVERVAIVGEGTIDANRQRRGGPKIIALKRCRFVNIQGVRLLNAPNYNISMLGTDFVNISGVTILNGYADGIDPDACQDVRISNCHIESVDDAIVPKASFSLGERRACENIVVTNCFLSTAANCFKLGTESGGDFKHITVSNCVMTGLKGIGHATSGISLESVDGANLDGVAISNVSMFDARAPVFIRLGSRCRDGAPAPGSIRNIIISNIVALNASTTSSITGIPGCYPEGITLSNIRLVYNGGGPARVKKDAPVPELEREYPSADMFETLPAYGLYCRHVKGLVLSNVQLLYGDRFWRIPTWKTWNRKAIDWWTPDGIPSPSEPGNPGPAFIAEDVIGLDVVALQTRAGSEGDPVVQFVNVRDALVRACRAPENTKVYLDIRGAQTSNIDLMDNIVRNAEIAVACAPDVPKKMVLQDGKQPKPHKR
jgi:hypothetical protein